MKTYALALLLFFCVVQNTLAEEWLREMNTIYVKAIDGIIEPAKKTFAQKINGIDVTQKPCYSKAIFKLNNLQNAAWEALSLCLFSRSQESLVKLCVDAEENRVKWQSWATTKAVESCGPLQ